MASDAEKQRRMELRREIGNRGLGVTSLSTPEPGPAYLVAFACLACHRSYKRPIEQTHVWYRKCPHCGDWAINLGRHFKPPKMTAKSQWKKVKLLVDHGFVFQHVYVGESGELVPYPETLEAARSFVVKYADKAIQVPLPPTDSEADGVSPP